MILKFPLEAQWQVFNTDTPEWAEKPTKQRRDILAFYEEYKRNPLAHFLPHGVAWCDKERVYADGDLVLPASDYPKEYGNDGVAFLNDRTSDGSIVEGCNQGGKSALLAAWTGFRVIPCQPDWPVFTKHGVEYHEWEGPKTWVMGSYSWDNVVTLFERVQFFFPDSELRQYATKHMPFGDGKPKRLHLACGSTLLFLCYTQKQEHWEGFTCNGGSFDEQVPKDKWIGWRRGTTTGGAYTPFGMALTGHVLKDRPDTGAVGWIKRDLCDGRNRMGLSVKRYHLNIESTPDAIIDRKTKAQLYDQWVNPDILRSEKEEKAAIARYWGGWEEGGGCVFDSDVYDRQVHIINPLWDDDKTPPVKKATLMRVIDYGDAGITCCGWLAMLPKFAVLYRILYEKNLKVADAVRKIIEMSHNVQEFEDRYPDEQGNLMAYYKEVQKKERFYRSVLDSRSFNTRQHGELTGDIFLRYGLEVEPADAAFNKTQLPVLHDWMRIDWTRQHPVLKNDDDTPRMGAPRLLFFDVPGMEYVIDEVEGLAYDQNDPLKIDKKMPHHAVDMLKYFATAEPRFEGDTWVDAEDFPEMPEEKWPYKEV